MVLERYCFLVDHYVLPFPSSVAKEKKGVEMEANGGMYNSTKDARQVLQTGTVLDILTFFLI